MTTSRLTLYNIALRASGERPISSLSEDADARRILDEVWESGNGTSGNAAAPTVSLRKCRRSIL